MTPHSSRDDEMPFWAHLDVLRGVLWRSLLAVVLCAVALFVAKESLFSCILAPCRPDFVTYRWLSSLAGLWGEAGGSAEVWSNFSLHLISTELYAQFQAHLMLALEGGLLVASPYLLWQCFGFVSPALYARERRFAFLFLPVTFVLFCMGVLLNYYLLFPIALRFLATYQVSDWVQNAITLASYVDTFTTMTLAVGLVFELPVAIWLLGRCHLVNRPQLRRYRRHALVTLMLLAALVTPPDVFTMFVVSLPLYLLYEVSIWTVKA